MSELQNRLETTPDFVPLFRSVLNHSLSPQRGNVAPVTAFTGLSPSPPLSTSMCSETFKPVTIYNIQHEKAFNTNQLIALMTAFHPVVQANVQENRRRA